MRIEELQRRPAYLVRRIRQISLALFAVAANGRDVTPQQYSVLRALDGHTALEQTRLCEVVALDRSTIASLLTRLECKGWVRRTPSAKHRRINDVSITQVGRRIREELEPVLDRVDNALFAPLSGEERKTLMVLLRRLVSAHEAGETS